MLKQKPLADALSLVVLQSNGIRSLLHPSHSVLPCLQNCVKNSSATTQVISNSVFCLRVISNSVGARYIDDRFLFLLSVCCFFFVSFCFILLSCFYGQRNQVLKQPKARKKVHFFSVCLCLSVCLSVCLSLPLSLFLPPLSLSFSAPPSPPPPPPSLSLTYVFCLCPSLV